MIRGNNRILLLLALVVTVYLVHLGLKRDTGSVVPKPGRGSRPLGRTGSRQGAQAALGSKPGDHAPEVYVDAEAENAAARRAQTHPLKTSNLDVEFNGVELDERGHVVFDAHKHSAVHPIRLLMERAKKQVEQIDTRIKAVTSLQDAVDDYVRAWKMRPPKGFDKWYEYVTKTKGIPLPSLFPMAHKPFLQYLAVPAKILRERVDETETKEPMYTITFVPDGTGDIGTACGEHDEWFPDDYHTRGRGRVKIGGGWAWTWRCNNTLNLMLPMLPLFPDEFFHMDPPVKLVFNSDDGPRGQVQYDVQQRGEAYGKAGRTWAPAQLEAVEQRQRNTYGWQWTCPPDSPLKQVSISNVLNREHEAGTSQHKSFVGDFYMSMDVCYNPELRDQNSFAIIDNRLANVKLAPHISISRTLRSTDITMVALDAAYQSVALVKWKDKEHAKVFWRGSPTGVSHRKHLEWRKSQRHRLNRFANNASNDAIPVLVERGNTVRAEAHRIRDMNQRWFDIGLTGGPTQCSIEDGSCDELQKEVEWKNPVRGAGSLAYKYVIDVDGNAWSSRFRRLLLSNHCVLKSTAYPEWFSDFLVPWYHYIPIRHDYGDVYDIMAFFEGAPDGSTKGDTHLAGEIAMNGYNFVHEHWRVPDMQAFTMLLFLEFWRVLADDREAITMK